MSLSNWIRIRPDKVVVDGVELQHDENGFAMLTEIYHKHIGDYPKFFKMDVTCKLGFVATELLLQKENASRFVPCEDRVVILFNRSGSLNADTHYQATIQDKDNYFPSPAAFVYTLPNIVTGEIAIRNKYYGETSFIVLERFDVNVMARQILCGFQNPETTSIIGGWNNCDDESHFDALLFILSKSHDYTEETLAKDILEIINY